MRWISSKELVVTGRYHTVTLCLLTRTPFLALDSNTPKIRALLIDVFGDDERMLYDPSALRLGGEVLNRSLSFSHRELERIDMFLNEGTKAAEQMISVFGGHN